MTCELEIVPVVVIRLAAEIDLTNRDQVYDQLCAAFAGGAAVVVADLTATSFCDCGSLRCLLAVQHRAAAREASSGSRSRPAARCGG